MLKNKFKIITLLMVIILAFTVPIVQAAEDTTATNEVNEQATQQAVDANASMENLKSEDIYLTGDEVTIDYMVDGNLFVFANTVNINSYIGGDAFIVANTINVNENGYIFSNLFAIGKDITISGRIYDLYACSNNITINGYIYRDIRTITDNLNISGIIGRNVYTKTNTINIQTTSNESEQSQVTSQGLINGNLNYTSSTELSIPEGTVAGSVNYTEEKSSNSASVQTYILSLGRFIVTVVLVWLICLWLAPKFLKNTSTIISKKFLPTLGYGILTPILAVIAFALLILLGITSTIATIGLAILFIGIALAPSIFAITINNLICNKLKIEKNSVIFGILIITSAILWAICIIPVVGPFVSIAISILGLGIIVKGILPSKNKDSKENSSKKGNTESHVKKSK